MTTAIAKREYGGDLFTTDCDSSHAWRPEMAEVREPKYDWMEPSYVPTGAQFCKWCGARRDGDRAQKTRHRELRIFEVTLDQPVMDGHQLRHETRTFRVRTRNRRAAANAIRYAFASNRPPVKVTGTIEVTP